MARTHPPSLLTLTRRALEAYALVPRGSKVLVATSGGPDSMALLHVLARLAPKLGFSVVAHGVDHGLRAAAASELDLAEALATSLEVPFGRTVLTTLTPGGNLQARAREARYAALRAAAAAADAPVIATAHHADDRAETVLLRLLRGSGARGLAVLPPRNGDLIRPFTRARRKDIEAHLARHGVPFARDPSNDDPRYGRARVRNEVLPLLETLSPGVVAHLNSLADELAELRRNPDESALAASPGTLLARATEAAVRLFAEGTLEGLSGIEGIDDDSSREETKPNFPGDEAESVVNRGKGSRGRLTLELPGGLVATYVRGSLTVTVVKSPKSAPRWKHRHPDDPHPMR